MVKVPYELYPDATGVEYIIDEYIDLGAKALKDYFPDRSAYVEYIEKLEQREDAEDLLEAGSYLYLIKNESTTSVRIVLFISLIEKINSKNHIDFASWINSEEGKTIFDSVIKKEKHSADDVRSIIQFLAETYRQKYGARNNFANFVESYVSKEDQFDLILRFRGWEKKIVSGYTSRLNHMPKVSNIEELKENGFLVEDRHLMPKCYDWKMCCVNYGSCVPQEGCLVIENPEKFSETIRSVAKLIYDMRSEIVHDAGVPSIIEKNEGAIYTGSTNIINGRAVLIEMTREELEEILIKALKKYFDSRPRLRSYT